MRKARIAVKSVGVTHNSLSIARIASAVPGGYVLTGNPKTIDSSVALIPVKTRQQ
jgi:hypothetical protein